MSIKINLSLGLENIKSLIKKGNLSDAISTFNDTFSKIEKSELIPGLRIIYDDFLILSSEYKLINSIQQEKDISDYAIVINKVKENFINILELTELKLKEDLSIPKKEPSKDDLVTIELKISKDLSEFSEKERLELLDTISKILKMDPDDLKVTHIRSGSTIIGIQLTLRQARELVNAIKLGKLKMHKIVETKLLEKVEEFTLNNSEPEESFLFVIELIEIKTKIKEMISKHPQKGLKELQYILKTSASSRFDEALMVIGRYNMNFNNQIDSLVKYEDTTIEFSKILKSAFKVINEIEEEDINKDIFRFEIG